MTIVNVLPALVVIDFAAAVSWYQALFGRAPDRRPMDGLAEWRLTKGGGVQLFHSADGAGNGRVTINVNDLDGYVTELSGRGISTEAFDTPSGLFRLATMQDPAGNTITLAEDLNASDAT